MHTVFPKDFLWGASSSAFQIEGAFATDGKGKTVADHNAQQRAHLQADTTTASDFYHHVEEDIALMQELGMKTYRFSFSWARIIPDGNGEINQAGLDFYHHVVDTLLAHNIKPMVTLYHFDLPYALVEKYNGWEDRRCIDAFERYANICFNEFGTKVHYWQINNEQNLMIRVPERMNMYDVPQDQIESVRAQMDYNMFVAHARVTNLCHKLLPDSKIGPAVSSTMTYPASNRPEDVWAARMNDNFKTNYALEMYTYGRYPGYYEHYLEKAGIAPKREAEDEAVLKAAKPDYLAVNYYRTLVVRHLPEDEAHPFGTKANEIDFDLYGYFAHEKNPNLVASTYGAQIDPMGLRLVLNEYYEKYRLPMIITENGLGTADELTADDKVHDDYRIDYLRQHIEACRLAIEDGVELFGYCPWSVMDLLSSHQGFKKRYGFIYIDRTDEDEKALRRIKKDSYYWYQNVIQSNGEVLV